MVAPLPVPFPEAATTTWFVSWNNRSIFAYFILIINPIGIFGFMPTREAKGIALFFRHTPPAYI